MVAVLHHRHLLVHLGSRGFGCLKKKAFKVEEITDVMETGSADTEREPCLSGCSSGPRVPVRS